MKLNEEEREALEFALRSDKHEREEAPDLASRRRYIIADLAARVRVATEIVIS